MRAKSHALLRAFVLPQDTSAVQFARRLPPAQLVAQNMQAILDDEEQAPAMTSRHLTWIRMALKELSLEIVAGTLAETQLDNAAEYFQLGQVRAGRMELRTLSWTLKDVLAKSDPAAESSEQPGAWSDDSGEDVLCRFIQRRLWTVLSDHGLN